MHCVYATENARGAAVTARFTPVVGDGAGERRSGVYIGVGAVTLILLIVLLILLF